MKLISKVILGISIIVLLGACATEHYDEYARQQRGIAADNQRIAQQFFAGQAARDALVLQGLGQKGDGSAMVLYSIMQGQQSMAVANAFRGQGLVAPTTNADIWKTAMGNTVPTIARWGFGYLLGSDLIEGLAAAGTTYNVGRDYTNMNTTLGAGGDISGVGTYFNNYPATDSFNPITDAYKTGLDTEPVDLNPAIGP